MSVITDHIHWRSVKCNAICDRIVYDNATCNIPENLSITCTCSAKTKCESCRQDPNAIVCNICRRECTGTIKNRITSKRPSNTRKPTRPSNVIQWNQKPSNKRRPTRPSKVWNQKPTDNRRPTRPSNAVQWNQKPSNNRRPTRPSNVIQWNQRRQPQRQTKPRKYAVIVSDFWYKD